VSLQVHTEDAKLCAETAQTAVFQELQLELEELQDVALLF